jgi:hypothetical protein
LSVAGQDAPPLGDAARQARQQKQQKDVQSKENQGKEAQPPKAAKVITNDEIPGHLSPALPHSADGGGRTQPVSYMPSASDRSKTPPEQWQSMILAQKNAISSMQNQIEKLNDSIHFASGSCVANCVQWNQRQREKQVQVEQMQAQLEDQKKRLEDMQESARRQGYGNSVYDP